MPWKEIPEAFFREDLYTDAAAFRHGLEDGCCCPDMLQSRFEFYRVPHDEVLLAPLRKEQADNELIIDDTCEIEVIDECIVLSNEVLLVIHLEPSFRLVVNQIGLDV